MTHEQAVLNRCDSCNREIGEHDGALCGPCADDEWDRWIDNHPNETNSEDSTA